jgi:hypothetical protein
LLWMRSGVDRHQPRAAAREGNQYVGVRGHPAGADRRGDGSSGNGQRGART